ncbi:MAG: hypothetical protein V1847_03030 [Candidatus Diapherotrites archaeon]
MGLFVERFGVALGGMILAVLVARFLLGLGGFGEAASFAIVVVVLGLAVAGIVAWKIRQRTMGAVVEDEFSKKVSFKSGYYAYLAGVWTVMALLVVSDFPQAQSLGIQGTALTLLGVMGIAYIVSYFVLARKGLKE